MKSTMIMVISTALLMPLVVCGQSIDNFDSEPDSGYWVHEISENADTTLSYVNISYVTDPVFEGAGAMQLDYSAHNIEVWGGYAKIYHMSSSTTDGPEPALAGTWKMAPEAGALMVGPAPNDGSWWSSSEDDVVTRACYFDDDYVFNGDGSFNNVLGDDTWIEGWQGGSDACGAPVYPHDGSNAATYTYDAGAGTITLNGVGAYLGLPKAHNDGELGSPEDAPESITYDITLSDNDNTMTLVIEAGAGVFWTFKLVADEPALAIVESWDLGFDLGTTLLEMRPNTGEVWDWSGYDSISFSYHNSVPQTGTGSQTVHLRLNLSDYGNVTDPSYTGLGEYYYSFHYILDNDPGWNTITMPLVRNDDWGGGGFNLTGWAGDAGNGELDRDAIAGFHLEFSIDGGGDGSYNQGTIVLDDFTLTGSLNALTNPGFETADESGDDFGWGWTHAGEGQAHTEIVTDPEMAYSGDNYAHIGVDNGAAWAVFYTEGVIPAAHGETWRLSGYAKSLSGIEGDYGFFKLEAKDADGNVLEDTGEIMIPITDEWGMHSAEFVMPQGTAQVTAVIVASRWDGSNCDYAFDEMFFMNVGVLDVVPPAAVENVSAVPGSYYNLVTWTDVPDESGEVYDVYASTDPITDISVADVVATGILEGAQAAVHYLYYPLVDTDMSYHYAVVCRDPSNNVGEPGTSSGSITNTALGIPTISLDPPANFVADGDLSEWFDSGIVPFELGTTDNSWGTPSIVGSVTDDNDLFGTIFLAVDEDYLYVAADVIDDVYDGYQSGDGTNGWWENDVLELFIGLYDQHGPKHGGMNRGDEPDYKFFFLETHAVNDFNSGDTLAVNGDGNYHQEGFNPDWVVEAKLALDDIAFGDDIRFNAVNGMRIPIEPTLHDNDGAGWEGNLVGSPFNTDNAWQTPSVWSSTWIGDQFMVGIDEETMGIIFHYSLDNNYPNPFNPSTTINYSLASSGKVRISVYNILGQEVATLVNKYQHAGEHRVVWNGHGLSSGVYIYRLKSNDFAQTKKMILMK